MKPIEKKGDSRTGKWETKLDSDFREQCNQFSYLLLGEGFSFRLKRAQGLQGMNQAMEASYG
jgi:hypothetical protein